MNVNACMYLYVCAYMYLYKYIHMHCFLYFFNQHLITKISLYLDRLKYNFYKFTPVNSMVLKGFSVKLSFIYTNALERNIKLLLKRFFEHRSCKHVMI